MTSDQKTRLLIRVRAQSGRLNAVRCDLDAVREELLKIEADLEELPTFDDSVVVHQFKDAGYETDQTS